MTKGGRGSTAVHQKYAVRRSTVFLSLALGGALILGFLIFIHPFFVDGSHEERFTRQARLVRDLDLTDLCIFTEARYTRHLSQADLHSAFQDNPMALEHFPSGSLVKPPALLPGTKVMPREPGILTR